MSSVLFVCLGNICRSPTAEGVFRVMASKQGVAVSTDSCGTAGWHQGNPPDPRSQAAAKAAGYPIDDLRARQVTLADFDRFDRVVAMDRQNLADLSALQPAGSRAELSLFLDFCDEPQDQVPDPYYGGDDGFAEVIRLVELASHGLLQALQSKS
ncbi:low molecular weight phosphotyrosine protein phosphatase [Litorivicinus lipolyticus]|uniref:protein-tyrosine-phosphatase n=1 Tax=Litorivicinus lipolyticus TaxID=418701 RepID=A0A5Q2QC32_9GAMM|nr:low molecular weight protein-tyrosine-phosphatase [Litorivicinus lipolyticus]QGG79832.1 low molecular weight phosphotyrosine protein phosphatase [Litorivicinus lipolyticus]